MYAALLRRLTANGMRKGLTGSTPWLVAGIIAAGLRVIRRIGHEDEVLYRTAIKAGDVFEIVTRPRR